MSAEEVTLSGGRETAEAARETQQVTRDKKKRGTPMKTLVSSHEMSCAIAKVIIPKHHHHLAAANIAWYAQNKPIKGVGGKVSKANPFQKYLVELVQKGTGYDQARAHITGEEIPYGEPLDHIWLGDANREEVDFIVMIDGNAFNNLEQSRRFALVDHLLCRMGGDEDEETGEMKWKLRDPDVVEYAEVAERRGAWNTGLEELKDCLGCVSSAPRVLEKSSAENWDPETAAEELAAAIAQDEAAMTEADSDALEFAERGYNEDDEFLDEEDHLADEDEEAAE